MQKRHRELLREVQKLGPSLVEARSTGGTHFVFRLTFNGNEENFTVANSASDHRARLNTLAVVKRWVRSVSPESATPG